MTTALSERIWLWFVILTSVGVSLYALSFAGGRAFPPGVATNSAGYPVLVVHVMSAGIALLLGPWQFLTALRVRWSRVHRLVGQVYIVACLIGAVAGGWLAWGTFAGPVARWGFLLLAVFWFVTTVQGYLAARRRDFVAHRAWILRSFALAFAAVTLRIYLPVSLASGVSFLIAYPAIAWACWVPNLLAAELYLRARPRPAQITVR